MGAFESKLSYHDIEGVHPATKEQRDLLFAKMKEAGFMWDAELHLVRCRLRYIRDIAEDFRGNTSLDTIIRDYESRYKEILSILGE